LLPKVARSTIRKVQEVVQIAVAAMAVADAPVRATAVVASEELWRMLELRCVVTMTVVMLLAACSGDHEGGLLRPGIGCGEFLIGRSRRADVITHARGEDYYAKKGLWFSFDGSDVLDTIVTTSSAFRSEKGLRPGDTEEQVEKCYGRGEVGRYELDKGDSLVGSIGEKTLVYPGIQFVIAQRKVWAIVIVP
jgi:hypothetical protein